MDDLNEVPKGSYVIYSAHGVSKAVQALAQSRGFAVFDATCPLVTKVHMEVARFSRQQIECILIGHAGHPEVEGTMGQYDSQEAGIYLVETLEDVAALELKDPTRCAYVTQTTLSMDDTNEIIHGLKQRFPAIISPKKGDICYATQNRQDAVKALAQKSDVVLVIGSETSSNSNRLKELAERLGTPAYMLDDRHDLQPAWLAGASVIGVTAGASAPEHLVQGVIAELKEQGIMQVEQLSGVTEHIMFALPKVLRKPKPVDEETTRV